MLDFTIDQQGNVEDIVVRSATHPAVGQAALAALELTNFKPAVQQGRTVSVPMSRKCIIAPPAETAVENEPEDHPLIRRVRGGETLPSPKGLDGKLAPLWRIPPRYPTALKADGGAGNAEIEFILDREGRCRLPRVVSASKEEFGWAAATAVSCWVFEPPRKGGEPVDIRIRVPFNFPAQAK